MNKKKSMHHQCTVHAHKIISTHIFVTPQLVRRAYRDSPPVDAEAASDGDVLLSGGVCEGDESDTILEKKPEEGRCCGLDDTNKSPG